MLNILTEASGSLTSVYIIEGIKKSGNYAIASDINEGTFANYLADSFIKMPKINDPIYWTKLENILVENNINIVIPSLDETLSLWSEKKAELKEKNIIVILSDKETVDIFQDKWSTFKFFEIHGIPTPYTSLTQKYSFNKPRFGRGSKGIINTYEKINMQNMISQEFIEGKEYTIDVLCDNDSNPVYIIPRLRIDVKDGKSVTSKTIKKDNIMYWVKKICEAAKFIGAINIQCIENPNGELKFIEVNPRLAGGMALAFAASENWINLMVKHFYYGERINVKEIVYELEMYRYYREVFAKNGIEFK